ncbi:MAG: serine--tRNA ligase [Candidatus Omnitrophica bacterium]|nr:serine--tRNA ligase [Candidatus Omnitrophota bacterium]
MLDPKFIRQNPEVIREALKKRASDFDLDAFLILDQTHRDLNQQLEELYAVQNRINKEVKQLLKDKKPPAEKIQESKEIKKEIEGIKSKFKGLTGDWDKQTFEIPNIPHASLPIGDISCNKIVKEEGEFKKFDFKPLDHITLAEHLDIIDFKTAAKLIGSNFALFKGEGARLERALINFMLDLHIKEHGYKEISPPLLANRVSMTTTGQLPKFEEDMYHLKDEDYFLIPTAEVPITNLHQGEILEQEELPIAYVSYTSCFRREAGSYGKETKGLVRLHQFDKVELVKFVLPENSYQELENLLSNACRVIELLEIPYRIVLLATGDISFAAAKCYDIEIYASGLDKWLEVSSCSNFENFQARRGNIRYREKDTKKLKYVHTLNGSGVALARLVICILENYQNRDGSVTIPEVLRSYMDGKTRIEK